LRPGGIALVALVVLAAVLTPTHPNHKSRMLHSWLPAVWVLAGMGAAALVYGRGTAGVPRLRPWLATVLVAGLVCLQPRAFLATACTMEGGPHPEQDSMLAVPEAYLPDLDGANRTLILTTLPLKPMAQWAYLQRHGSFARLEERWYGFGALGDENRHGFANWLHTTDCDTLIYCESTIPRPGVDSGPECELHAELKDVLTQQQVFRLDHEHLLPHLACRVQVWRKKN
jgi:hypothetical protein